MSGGIKIDGRDNYGRPRQAYADNLVAMDDSALLKETEKLIWLSAYASNNPRSDYHWQADACHDEARRRGKPDLYQQGYDQAVASCR